MTGFLCWQRYGYETYRATGILPALTNSLPGVSNTNQEASIGGSVAAAHYIRSVAPLYGVPVVLHTAREGSLHVGAVVLIVIGSLREEAFAMVGWHGKIKSPIRELQWALWLNKNTSLRPTRLTTSSTANPCSPHSTFCSVEFPVFDTELD